MIRTARAAAIAGTWTAAALLSAGCHKDMYDQPKYRPLEASGFFQDDRSSRPLEPGTVPLGRPPEGTLLTTGRLDGAEADLLPFPATEAVLRRGRERFDIFCSPCHGRVGDGAGMIVRRGFPRPPSFHAERLRREPLGHFFRVITDGYGKMFPYGSRLSPEDRWAVAAYIRALQLSQRAPVADLAPSDRERLETAP